jgi:hypothetical protein
MANGIEALDVRLGRYPARGRDAAAPPDLRRYPVRVRAAVILGGAAASWALLLAALARALG